MKLRILLPWTSLSLTNIKITLGHTFKGSYEILSIKATSSRTKTGHELKISRFPRARTA